MNPLVSVNCIAYNHAPFIRDALDGFVMQKTSFPFEVVLHDDASTDGTQDIIREYERNYPKLFNIIYQKENQYSKTTSFMDIGKKFILPRIRGKYVADCEGDDYWTDPYKLQKQVDYMESHEDCACTFHSVIWLKDDKVFKVYQPWFCENNVDSDTLILHGSTIVSTCSMLYRFERLNETPKFKQIADVGDYPAVCHLLTRGHFHFFPEIMAAYRYGRAGSWTEKYQNDDKFAVNHHLNALKWLYEFNNYSDNKYVVPIGKKIRSYIKGIETMGYLPEYPWLSMLLFKASGKSKKLKNLEKILEESNGEYIAQQYKNAEFEYYSWFVKTLGEKLRGENL